MQNLVPPTWAAGHTRVCPPVAGRVPDSPRAGDEEKHKAFGHPARFLSTFSIYTGEKKYRYSKGSEQVFIKLKQ